MKKRIIEAVEGLGGCKTIDLIPYLGRDGLDDLSSTIEELVESGQLLEVEYCLPSQPNRIKSLLFPAGTKILEK